MKFLIALLIAFSFSVDAMAAKQKHHGKKAKTAKHSVVKNAKKKDKKSSKKSVAKNTSKKSKKMSEKERKALAWSQVQKARAAAKAREEAEAAKARELASVKVTDRSIEPATVQIEDTEITPALSLAANQKIEAPAGYSIIPEPSSFDESDNDDAEFEGFDD